MESASRGASVIVERGFTCRMCMGNREYSVNIFYNSEVYKIPVWKVMMDLLHVEVSKDDGLPDTVCRRCVRKLLEFKEFKELCLKSATELRKFAQESDLFCPVKEEELETSGRALESIDATYSTGNDEPVTSLSTLTPGTLAVDNMCPVKEEEERVMEVAAEEEVKREDDNLEHLNSSLTAASNMDPVVVDSITDVRCGRLSFMKEECNGEYDTSDSDMLEMGFAGFDMPSLASGNELDRCNNIGGLTEEPKRKSDKFRASTPGISQNKVLNNSYCDPVREENLQLEYSMANSYVAHIFPEKRVKKQKKNVKDNASSNKFSQFNDRARPVRNQEREQLSHQAENTNYPTEYICNYCSTRYSEKESLALHIKRHVDGENSASTLPKEFPPRFSQNLLAKDPGSVEPVTLETSNTSFMQKSSRRKKEKQVVEESSGGENLGREKHRSTKLLSCNVKPVKLREKVALVCDSCGIAFLKKSELVKHVNVHTGLNPFHCRFCGKNLRNTYNLKRHVVIHTGVKSFKCNVCGKMFTQRCSLKMHSVVHTGVKSFKCNECGKMFTQKGSLNTHLLVHTGEKAFKCKECGKMFTTRSHLKMHSVVHTGVKSFKCNECGKMFTQKGSLNTHLLVHTGVKAFKCKECGKMFTTSSYLKMHSVVHTGVKPFKCFECGKTFSRKSHVKVHSVVHTGVKPFKCNECGKMFTQRGYLRSHSRIHSDVNPLKCDVCGRQFKWKHHFISHLRTHAEQHRLK